MKEILLIVYWFVNGQMQTVELPVPSGMTCEEAREHWEGRMFETVKAPRYTTQVRAYALGCLPVVRP